MAESSADSMVDERAETMAAMRVDLLDKMKVGTTVGSMADLMAA